jgi:hypothetical protein
MSESCKFGSNRLEKMLSRIDDRPAVRTLLANLRAHLPELEALLAECNAEWAVDDGVYRFYHQSFEAYLIQTLTLRVVDALQALAPNRPLNRWFTQIVSEGSRKTFRFEDNQRWLEVTRPIIEAFFHARHLLTVAVQSARELQEPPALLPTKWATVLYLYDLR